MVGAAVLSTVRGTALCATVAAALGTFVPPSTAANERLTAPGPGTRPAPVVAHPVSPVSGPTDPGLVLAPGSLLMPVAGIDPARLQDTYRQPRGDAAHGAVDIMAPRGTPVVAVADGRIAKLFLSKPGGLTVYQFDASERLVYYYAHLDRYAPGLAEGQRLRRGDPIGTVGSTGNASADAPHLHFAVHVLGPARAWWQGTPVNPFPLIAGSPGAPARSAPAPAAPFKR
jgi:peptidoglycan LD-endopeptidase LytH